MAKGTGAELAGWEEESWGEGEGGSFSLRQCSVGGGEGLGEGVSRHILSLSS